MFLSPGDSLSPFKSSTAELNPLSFRAKRSVALLSHNHRISNGDHAFAEDASVHAALAGMQFL